jgi:dienelactone hydrolase
MRDLQDIFTQDVVSPSSRGSLVRRRRLLNLAGAAALGCFAAGPVRGQTAPVPEMGPFTPGQQTIRMPLPLGEQGQTVALVTTILRPDGPGPYPLMMFHHGSTGRGNNPALFSEVFFPDALAAFFASRGWLVVAPMRRGRGGSDGDYAEGLDQFGYSRDPAIAVPGIERAITDIHAATNWFLARPDVDRGRVVVAGVSRGGFLAVVYAGRYPQIPKGVINFVGGWLSDRGDANAVNRDGFRLAGSGQGPRSLWLYGEHDSYYPIAHSRANFDAFRAGGGNGEFLTFDVGPGQNGHSLYRHAALWSGPVEKFLAGL